MITKYNIFEEEINKEKTIKKDLKKILYKNKENNIVDTDNTEANQKLSIEATIQQLKHIYSVQQKYRLIFINIQPNDFATRENIKLKLVKFNKLIIELENIIQEYFKRTLKSEYVTFL